MAEYEFPNNTRPHHHAKFSREIGAVHGVLRVLEVILGVHKAPPSGQCGFSSQVLVAQVVILQPRLSRSIPQRGPQ
ncbi:hypothetical protein KL936_001978 [Ogataea polymorpha]|nr:hypothetical protein KL936_001978 [Ogataea polymorpha]